jgi:uncharacterized membrane protein YsdA (DUF1294 family)
MSERLPQYESNERLAKPENNKEQNEKLKELVTKAERAKDNKELIPELTKKAEEQAISAEDYPKAEKENKQANSLFVSRELKHQTFVRTITRVRKRLPKPQRALSKVVHQPAVDAVSRIGEKTIARPSGLLGGSILAFFGSSAFLWAARHYGFTYNYLLFFLLFVAGFMIGMIIELAIAAARRKRT